MTRRANRNFKATQTSKGGAFVRPSRRVEAPLSEAECRKAWADLVAQAAAVAAVVEAGRPVELIEASTFAGRLIRLKAGFPLRWPSAQAAAEAFLIVARAFVAGGAKGGGHPPALAGFLAAGAACLADLLEGETRARFARSCAAVGGD